MEESQTIKNGRTYLETKRTIMLGISPGNAFFHKIENLQKVFQLARNRSQQKVGIYLTIILRRLGDYKLILISREAAS